ncbi:MAG TPA: hypothetical protein VMU10_03730 [Desulfomonilia bacterium]|nr:hypothetical protein [Desulfomonilia bacterium]
MVTSPKRSLTDQRGAGDFKAGFFHISDVHPLVHDVYITKFDLHAMMETDSQSAADVLRMQYPRACGPTVYINDYTRDA